MFRPGQPHRVRFVLRLRRVVRRCDSLPIHSKTEAALRAMTQAPISKNQFVGWLVVFTIGMALWASPGDSLWGVGIGLLAIGNLILMAPRELSRPVPARDVLWIFGTLLAFAFFMIASKRWLPEDFGASVARAIRYPALVAALWALAVWRTYGRSKVTKTDGHHAT